MPRNLWGTLLAGLFLPLILSIGFVVGWKYLFKKDALVREHFNIHKKVHVMSLIALFLGDYRNWKVLYTNVSPATKMLAFKVQFKRYNRAWSFASLVSDGFLIIVGASSMTVGIQQGLVLLQVIAVERILVSGALVVLTITEWAYKSKITAEDKRLIANYGQVEDESNLNALKKNGDDANNLDQDATLALEKSSQLIEDQNGVSRSL